jgi:hypothetical protein
LNVRDRERALVAQAIARLRAGIVAVVSGMVTGIGLFIATLWLVIKGGENVGQNLSLLSHYYPGYSVTWLGSFVGLVYGAITGALLGWTVAWMYNAIANWRNGG